ncbi:DNA-binding helix-turn-helix protein [Peptoanaerobacter stomatis]|uniref:DNA-binding helix-turn-helix protein n=1 Tax=Peptoanaerobacter stomatis TaxID=796937 RepID=J5UCA7_9FIRM|nr:helix-turn-helix transcriptional regulator [Peptoanaerobacter stomatis]EJU21449.1 DNA-binding helix-turn-helix protein [Peptoanaerobacter stomatis]
MSLFDRLEQLIKDKNMTISELERKVGFGKSTIANWKKSYPTYDKLIKVVNYLNADIVWLVSDDLKTTYNSSDTYTYPHKVKEDLQKYGNNSNLYDNLDIETQKAFNLLLKKIVSQNTAEERRILSLYNLLGSAEKNQIEGMLELKVKECMDKKIKSSSSDQEDKNNNLIA